MRKMAQPTILGRECTSCGDDKWVKYGPSWRCLRCSRKRAAAYQTQQRMKRPARNMWTKAKARAKAKGTPFTITPEDILDVWPADNRCPASGVTMRMGKGRPSRDSPTLDRLNSAWGYEPGNIAVISSFANRVKSDATASELVMIAQWMLQVGLN